MITHPSEVTHLSNNLKIKHLFCRCKRVFTEEPKSVPIANKKVEQKKKEQDKPTIEKQL